MMRRRCASWLACCFSFALGQPVVGESLPPRPAAEPAASNSAGSAPTRLAPEEKEKPPAVRHLGENSEGWHVTETRNFRILHNQSKALAEKTAQAAEQARSAALNKWLTEGGKDWQPRCDLYLHASGADFSRATGLPATVPGVSSTRCENGRVVSRRIDLRVDAESCIEAVLPHEVTHSVMEGCFTERRLSPWANEGIAVLAEPRSKIRMHLRNLPHYHDQDQLYSARELIHLKDYPEPRWMGPFYAQSVSLVEFLAKEKDPQTVTQFLHDGLRDGYEAALRRHYGWDFKDLDRRWREYAFSQ
jgi:hypothetical protein